VTKPNPKLQGGASPEPDESEDVALVSFLRANTPPVSDPGLGLEEQLMQAISEENPDAFPGQKQSRSLYRWNGVVAAFIGLGVGAIALGLGQLHQWFAPSGLSSAELAQLETFMVGDWDETVRPSEMPRDWEWLDAKLIRALPAASAQSFDPSLSDHSQP
jgi:hypothetical protein